MTTESKCLFSGGKQPALQNGPTNQDWWPNQLSLKPLHQHSRPIRWIKTSTTPMPSTASIWRRSNRSARPDDRLAGMVAGGLGHYGGLFIRMPAGTAPAPTASATAAAAQAKASSASPRSTAGRTTSASTRRAVCCGLSSRNTAATSPGRPDYPDRQRGAGIDGLQNLRLRRRPRRHLSRTTSTGALRRSGWN